MIRTIKLFFDTRGISIRVGLSTLFMYRYSMSLLLGNAKVDILLNNKRRHPSESVTQLNCNVRRVGAQRSGVNELKQTGARSARARPKLILKPNYCPAGPS